MPKISSIIKNNKVVLIVIIIFFTAFAGFWNVVSEGYDKQNKTILFLKKFIPSKISRKVRDTIFIIPNLKERNKFLSTQVKKFEQGLNGDLFNEEADKLAYNEALKVSKKWQQIVLQQRSKKCLKPKN